MAGMVVALAGTAQAATISVTNHSFETGPFSSGKTSGTPSGWTKYDNGSVSRNDAVKAHDYDGGLDPRPDASAHNLFLNGWDVFQVLGTTLEANMIYTLTVDVGDRGDTPHGEPVVQFGYGATHSTNVLATANTTSHTTPDDGWETWVLTFETGSSPAGLGEDLRIELIANGQSDAQNFQPQFDNVLLDGTAVPEPSTFALAALGSLGLLGWGRRRRR